MSSQLRATARKVVGYVGRAALGREASRRAANLAFAHGSPRLQDLFVRLMSHAGAPEVGFEWRVRLDSGAEVIVPVRAGDLRSWQFAQSYQWHDRGCRRTESALLDRIPRDGRLFDVGANMGLRSIYALAQGRPVTMFEPNRELRPFTEVLLRRNAFASCTIENLCVGSHEGSIQFFLSQTSYLSSIHRAQAGLDGAVTELEVPLTTLDAYVAIDPGSRSCAVMKIDVEGAELDVLHGAKRVLEVSRPCILIEARPDTCEEMNACLSGHGYAGFRILERVSRILVPVGRRAGSESRASGSSNFLYLPVERAALAEEIVRTLGSG